MNDLRFADDIVVRTYNPGDAQQLLIELADTTEKMGFCINKQKAKVITNLVLGWTININTQTSEEVRFYNCKARS